MTLSLCMIVKNEEKVIARSLNSIKDYVDEIVIVDTGSTDQTKKICSTFTNKIYDFTWVDDFSSARNFSFSKAECDYIIWLDADDVISFPDGKKLNLLKRELSKTSPDVVFCPYATSFDENGNPSFTFMRERIVKRGNFFWTGFVHECIIPSGKIIYSNFTVRHYSTKNAYSDRNLKIYQKHISNGAILDERHSLYYAKEFFYLKRYEECKNLLEKFLTKSTQTLYVQDAINFLGQCYEQLEEIDTAISTYLKCFTSSCPSSEIICRLANLYKALNPSLSVFYYKCALNTPPTPFGAFINAEFLEFIPCVELSVLLYNTEYKKAKRYHNRAKKLRPRDKTLLFNDKYFNA